MISAIFFFGLGYAACYVKTKFGYSLGLKLKKVEAQVKDALEK